MKREKNSTFIFIKCVLFFLFVLYLLFFYNSSFILLASARVSVCPDSFDLGNTSNIVEISLILQFMIVFTPSPGRLSCSLSPSKNIFKLSSTLSSS